MSQSYPDIGWMDHPARCAHCGYIGTRRTVLEHQEQPCEKDDGGAD